MTEQVAIFLYLADLFPQAGLTPAIDDPLRGPYLRWIAYYGSSFEPALIDHAMKREPAPASHVALRRLRHDARRSARRSSPRARICSATAMTAADVLWGTAFNWTTMFGLVPKRDVFVNYAARMTARPAFQRVTAEDAEMAARHAAACAS